MQSLERRRGYSCAEGKGCDRGARRSSEVGELQAASPPRAKFRETAGCIAVSLGPLTQYDATPLSCARKGHGDDPRGTEKREAVS